jgi:hypothetical protein
VGWRCGHWQGQEDSDVLAVLAFVKDDAGPGFLDPVMYPELVERNRLGHDVIWHAILLGDGAEPGLDSEQLVRVLVDLMQNGLIGGAVMPGRPRVWAPCRAGRPVRCLLARHGTSVGSRVAVLHRRTGGSQRLTGLRVERYIT